jgi:basic membrane protein A
MAVCADCEVLGSYLNFEFSDPNLGKEAALALYGQDADIVFAVAGLSGQGVFEAAVEVGKFAIGVDSDQDADAPGTVIVSMMKRTDQTTYLLIENSLEGNFQPGFNQLDMSDGVVDLSWTGTGSTVFADNGPEEMVAKLPDVQAAVEDYRAQILDGSLAVCDALNEPDSEACAAAKP